MEAWSPLLRSFLLLFLSGNCAAYPPKQYKHNAVFDRAENQVAPRSSYLLQQQQVGVPERQPVNTVSVICHPDSVEVVVQADLFGVGAPVSGEDLRLGVEHADLCRATATSGDQFRFLVGLQDCGTKHWMTDESLVYTNLLVFSPAESSDGVIRMEEAVIPIECHYSRKYSLSTSSLVPTWVPFTSTQAAVETLDFNLRIMTSDWLYERSSNVFYLGEPIRIEASVAVGHHMGLRVFLSSCVATPHPDLQSTPRYVFIEDGCLLESQLPGSGAHFVPRTLDDKLYLQIDAFRFHKEDERELYVTCLMTAVALDNAQAPNKACTFVNGRWRSADGNDYMCAYCQNRNEAGQTQSSSVLEPRGSKVGSHHKGAWRNKISGNKIWEQEQQLGPVLVLPGRPRSGPVPEEDLPPLLGKLDSTAVYGSQWRGGIGSRKDLEDGWYHDPNITPEQAKVQTKAPEPAEGGAEVDQSRNATDSRGEDDDADETPPDAVTSQNLTTAPPAATTSTPSDTIVTKVQNVTTTASGRPASGRSASKEPKKKNKV